jgi:FkbM family methyltransferase
VTVKPLKDIVPNQAYEVIKMDVQGAELEIMEGSLDLFKKQSLYN